MAGFGSRRHPVRDRGNPHRSVPHRGRVRDRVPVHVDPGHRSERLTAVGSAVCSDDAHRQRRRCVDPHLLGRLHARRPAVPAFLRIHEPVHRVHDDARSRRQLRGDVRRVGARWSLVVPVDQLLVRQAICGCGRQEGVHRQPHRRLGFPDRPHDDLRSVRHPRLRDRVRRGTRCSQRRIGDGDHTDALHRSDRQVRTASSLRVAPRRHGGPDAGIGPYPCRHDGDGRCLHDRPHRRPLRTCPDHSRNR